MQLYSDRYKILSRFTSSVLCKVCIAQTRGLMELLANFMKELSSLEFYIFKYVAIVANVYRKALNTKYLNEHKECTL